MAKSNSVIPEGLAQLLAAADKSRGFPAGTMASVMQQETGGNQKYISDPTTYHYAANAAGQRIAGHTGKISTAFGPFGILESTGRDPGYGVTPLKSKDLEEQIRFASDYLAARSKNAGGLHAGLAGYGEGEKYATQVQGRMTPQQIERAAASPPEITPPLDATTQVASQPINVVQPTVAQVTQPIEAPAVASSGPDVWMEFQRNMQARQSPQAETLASYGAPMAIPNFAAVAPPTSLRPNFQAFTGYGRRA